MPRPEPRSPSLSHSSLPSSSLSSIDSPAAPLVAIENPAVKARPSPTRRVTLTILESARFSKLSKELHSSSRALVRSQSSASKSSFSSRTGTSTHGSRVSQSDYENYRDGPVDDLDLDDDPSEQDLSEMSRSIGPSEPPAERTSAKAKSTTGTDRSHPSTPPPVSTPEYASPRASTSASRPSRSHVPHISTSTPFNPSKPTTRSPSRPLSNTTANTGNDTDKTITPSTPRPRRSRPPFAHPGHIPAPSAPPPPQYEGSYIDLDVSFSADQSQRPRANGDAAMLNHTNRQPRRDYGYQYQYDPTMPPPPVPMSIPAPVPAPIVPPAKERRKPAKLFGISLPGRGRSRARDTENLGFGRAGTDGWGATRMFTAPANLSPERHEQRPSNPIFAPQPRTAIPTVTPSMPFSHNGPAPVPPRAGLPPRPQSSPPASPSERDERCSPLFGITSLPRLFGSRASSRDRSQSHSRTRSKGKEKVREKPRDTPLVVSVPMLRTRTHSKDGRGNGPGRHGSFDFERPPPPPPGHAMQRSASAAGARAARHPHPAASAAAHARGPTHPPQVNKYGHGHGGQAYARSHSRSRGHPSPHSLPHSPLVAHATGASANSQSTGTGTGTGTTAGGGVGASADGSWGRKAGWLRAGVLPPFAFEPAVSGEGSGRASPVSEGRGRDVRVRVREVGGRDERFVREREWDGGGDGRKGKEKEREGKGEGRWEEREVDLGLGLAWAPSKIKVREWTGRPSEQGVMEKAWEREGERRARARERERERGWDWERERERERGRRYPYEGVVKRERDVTEQFREVLGAEGFDKFRRYVRRYDDNQIHLEGPNGLLARVRLLLDSAPFPRPSERQKRELLDDLMRIVHENDF
ncbi:hypothetical protein DENSPDRAFT_882097 [Dentipellis sp. KUC8613]|nr:hypothetical protein DENSPDRAFT_882097 [Dentipellis sp. KUC8613]